MKNKIILENIIVLIFFLFISCQTKESKITIKRVLIEKEIKLPLPRRSIISVNKFQIIKENGNNYLVVYFFPQHKLFVYDLQTKALVNEIPVYKNLSEIENFRYVNKDSIWIFGASSLRYNYDSSLMVINNNGAIKCIYPFHNNYFISLKTHPELYCDSIDAMDKAAIDTVLFAYNNAMPENFIINNKVFFTTKAGNVGLKSHLPHLPIVGYYDVRNKKVRLNNRLYYPFFVDSLFYPRGNRFYYYPIHLSFSHSGKILLSFSYTPSVIEWNYEQNRVDAHRVFSQLIDSIYPYIKPIDFDPDTADIYFNLFYAKNLKMYLRFAMLSNDYGNSKILIFSDTNYNYLGEAIIKQNEMPMYVYGDNFVFAKITGDSLNLIFFKYEFKPLDIKVLKQQLDSIYLAVKKNKTNEICAITGRKEDFSNNLESIFRYLNKFGINDSSYAVIILNKNGCHSCNDYIANIISMNQRVFFNLKNSPFYLLYVDEGAVTLTVKRILNEYEINENSHLKIDTTNSYTFFNSFNLKNPRLILVKDKKIISDTVYLPDNLETLVDRWLKFYGLKTK